MLCIDSPFKRISIFQALQIPYTNLFIITQDDLPVFNHSDLSVNSSVSVLHSKGIMWNYIKVNIIILLNALYKGMFKNLLLIGSKEGYSTIQKLHPILD